MARASAVLGVLLFSLGACESSSDSDDAHAHGGEGGEHSHEGIGGQSKPGSDMCCELGAICHSLDADVSEEVQECHELGHRNDPDACAESYEHCKKICSGVTDAPTEHACD